VLRGGARAGIEHQPVYSKEVSITGVRDAPTACFSEFRENMTFCPYLGKTAAANALTYFTIHSSKRSAPCGREPMPSVMIFCTRYDLSLSSHRIDYPLAVIAVLMDHRMATLRARLCRAFLQRL
jgi:hypothetical protein